MENNESRKKPYEFTKLILFQLSLVSLLITYFFYPVNYRGPFRVTEGLIFSIAIGNAAALVVGPLIIVWLFKVIIKLKKVKLESNEFWKAYFIVWIIFTILSIIVKNLLK